MLCAPRTVLCVLCFSVKLPSLVHYAGSQALCRLHLGFTVQSAFGEQGQSNSGRPWDV